MRPSFRGMRGFTIVELVVIIAIAGILAAFVAARINTQSFDTEGFANETRAMIRYAQKVAIAQRRTVAVVFVTGAGGNIKLCYTDFACLVANEVREPGMETLFQRTAKSTVSLSGVNFTFNSLGKPNAGQTVTVSGDVVRSIVIEAETGYVR
jgi:MSHA pilin protein MshC